MGSYALILEGKVTNTILWEGPEVAPMEFDEGITYVEIPDEAGTFPSTGWLYDGAVFTAPPLTAEEKESNEQAALAANVALKQSLMDEASNKISVLQDAVDLEMATDEETAALPLWKKYRVLLNRINANTSETVAWPDKPAS